MPVEDPAGIDAQAGDHPGHGEHAKKEITDPLLVDVLEQFGSLKKYKSGESKTMIHQAPANR